MSATTHTPGPWHIIEGPADDYQEGALIVEADAAGEDVATVNMNSKHAAANARLLAVAPEMKAELDETWQCLDLLFQAYKAADWACMASIFRSLPTRAAIAKAEGHVKPPHGRCQVCGHYGSDCTGA